MSPSPDRTTTTEDCCAERLGHLNASSGVVPSVWFTVPGVVAALSGGSLAADQAYVAAYKKCTGRTTVPAG